MKWLARSQSAKSQAIWQRPVHDWIIFDNCRGRQAKLDNLTTPTLIR